MSVLDRSCFSYQVAAGSTMSENSVVLVIRKSSDISRSSLPVGASSRQVTSTGRAAVAVGGAQRGVGAQQMAQEVLVALGRGAEQVGPPHASGTRGKFSGVVRVLAGEPQLPGWPARRRHAPRRPCPARCGLVGQVERVAVERRVGGHPTQPGRPARCRPRWCARRSGPWPAARPARRRVNWS